MIIGTEITIMGLTWQIELVDEVRAPDGAKCFGETDHNLLMIRIDKNNIEQQKFQSFCHEILHVIFHALGYQFNDKMKHDERTVEQISGIMAQIIPQIVAWQSDYDIAEPETISEAEYKSKGI